MKSRFPFFIGGDMKKLFKFVASLMITVVISTTTAAAYVQPVEAATDSVWKKAGIKFVEAIAGVFGTVLGEGAVEPIGINGEMQAYIDSIYGTDDLTENGDGTFTFSEEAITQIKTLLDEHFAQEENVPGVVWIPTMSYEDLDVTRFRTVEDYQHTYAFCKEHALTMPVIDCTGAVSYLGYFTPQIFDISGLGLRFYSESYVKPELLSSVDYLTNTFGTETATNLIKAVVPITQSGTDASFSNAGVPYRYFDSSGWTVDSKYFGGSIGYGWSYVFFNPFYNWFNMGDWSSAHYAILVRGAENENVYVPIFKSLDAYKQYIVGQADYYQLTPTYQGGALTIDPNIDYGKLYDAVSAAMSKSAANGENVTQQLSAMQDAYEATMQEISGTLGDIEDNTEQSNSWLEKIYNNTASIASILIEQFDAMTETINNGFASVVDGLSDVSLGLGEIGDSSSGGSDSGGGSKLSFWDRLGNFFGTTLGGVFDLISIIIMKALDGVGWLADKLIDNLGKALDGVSEIMDRYTKKITENNTLSKLGEAIPPELKDLFTFFFFGVIGAGIIRAAKK